MPILTSQRQGRYIPVFASAIYDNNPRLIEAGLTPINISSVMIGMEIDVALRSSVDPLVGNGCTDFATMYPSYYRVRCEDPTFPATDGIR